jgi:HemY protein
MIRIFLLLLACISGAWYVGDAIKQKGPGYVYVYYNHYSLETSFWFGLLLAIGLVVGIFIITKLMYWFLYYLVRVGYLPKFFGVSRSKKLKLQGSLAYINGQWQLAGKKLAKAAKNSESPFIDYVMAAKANLAMNQIAAAAEQAKLAEQCKDFDAVTYALLELDIAIANNDAEQQEQHLLHMLVEHGEHYSVLSKAIEIFRAQKKWRAIQNLLPSIKKRHVLNEQEYANLLADMAIGMMPTFTKIEQRKELAALWKQVAKVHDRDDVVKEYCAALVRMQEVQDAQKTIEIYLKRQWSDVLIEQLSTLSGVDNAKQLTLVESFLNEHTNSPALFMALGVINRKQGLLAKAKEHFLRSIQLRPSVKAYEYLAEIAIAQQDHIQLQHCLRHALQLAKQGSQ